MSQFVSKVPETLEALKLFNEAMNELHPVAREKIEAIIAQSCKPAEFRVRNMKGIQESVGRAIAVGIMLRMSLLIEEFPDNDE